MTPDTPSDPPPQTIDLPGGPLVYTDEGEGPTVLLVHGLPGGKRDFRWLAPCLSDACRVVRPDLPGWGDTPLATHDGPRLEDRADVVCDLVEALGLSRVVLGGHSMGGAVCLAARERLGSKLAGLAFLAAPGPRPHRRMRDWKPAFVARLLRTPLRRPLMRPLRAGFAQAGFPPVSDEQLLFTMRCVGAFGWADHARRVHALDVPTLVAWCDDDHLIETPRFEELAAAVPSGPRLRFDTGGHILQKTRAVEIGEALLTFASALH